MYPLRRRSPPVLTIRSMSGTWSRHPVLEHGRCEVADDVDNFAGPPRPAGEEACEGPHQVTDFLGISLRVLPREEVVRPPLDADRHARVVDGAHVHEAGFVPVAYRKVERFRPSPISIDDKGDVIWRGGLHHCPQKIRPCDISRDDGNTVTDL